MVEMDAEKVSGGKAHFTLLDKVVGNDLMVQQGIIAGCVGGNYTNVIEAAHALVERTVAVMNFHWLFILLPSRYSQTW